MELARSLSLVVFMSDLLKFVISIIFFTSIVLILVIFRVDKLLYVNFDVASRMLGFVVMGVFVLLAASYFLNAFRFGLCFLIAMLWAAVWEMFNYWTRATYMPWDQPPHIPSWFGSYWALMIGLMVVIFAFTITNNDN